MIALSDAGTAALFGAIGVVIAALIAGVFGMLFRLQSSVKTGNSHTLGAAVTNLERRFAGIGRLLAAHMRSANDLVDLQLKFDPKSPEYLRGARRYLDRQSDALRREEEEQQEEEL